MNDKEENKNNNDGCLSGCAGCGCFLIILWVVLCIVSWAWHIHWLFGLLMLLFLLGLR